MLISDCAIVSEQVVSWDTYNAKLESLNLMVKARNFLVFQVISFLLRTPSRPSRSRLCRYRRGCLVLGHSYVPRFSVPGECRVT